MSRPKSARLRRAAKPIARAIRRWLAFDLALERMEQEYEACNFREVELTKHISLRMHFPMEFLRLKIRVAAERIMQI